MIRVGFVIDYGDGWLGGINYFRSLFKAIDALPERRIEVVIFTGRKTPTKYFDSFPPVEIVRSNLFDRGSFPWLIRKLQKRVSDHDQILERLLEKHGVALLSHSGWLGEGASIPAIGWIPDFQHVHLPENFDAQEIALRDQTFNKLCRYCSALIVSSYDAQTDLVNTLAGCKDKSEVLQFVVSPVENTSSLPGRTELEARYEFSGKYFLLPNQFWRHKNHRVVIEALGLLRSEGRNALILATGSTEDYRNPKYFDSLLSYANKLGVEKEFRPLGLIPADDLAALMLHASAIINPSHFEGWSTSVEEGKSLGKRIVLSDIAVHREQNPSRAIYFHPDDAAALAVALWDIWIVPEEDEALELENARAATRKRRLEFAKKYQQIVMHVLESQ